MSSSQPLSWGIWEIFPLPEEIWFIVGSFYNLEGFSPSSSLHLVSSVASFLQPPFQIFSHSALLSNFSLSLLLSLFHLVFLPISRSVNILASCAIHSDLVDGFPFLLPFSSPFSSICSYFRTSCLLVSSRFFVMISLSACCVPQVFSVSFLSVPHICSVHFLAFSSSPSLITHSFAFTSWSPKFLISTFSLNLSPFVSLLFPFFSSSILSSLPSLCHISQMLSTCYFLSYQSSHTV